MTVTCPHPTRCGVASHREGTAAAAACRSRAAAPPVALVAPPVQSAVVSSPAADRDPSWVDVAPGVPKGEWGVRLGPLDRIELMQQIAETGNTLRYGTGKDARIYAVDGGAIVYSEGVGYSSNIVIHSFFVDPARRRQGIATRILDDMLNHFPGEEVDPGGFTEEGRPLWERWVASRNLLEVNGNVFLEDADDEQWDD